jgi:hypothetical protein
MTGNGKTAPGDTFVKMTRDLLESDAWRSLSINARRVLDFLMREHLVHGGKENGELKAPQHQLETFGIGVRYISEAIAQTEELGLVDCRRYGLKVASTYTLTWLPNHDGTPPTNRWRAYRNQSLRPLPVPKSRNLPLKGKVALPLKGGVDGSNLPLKGGVDDPKNLPLKGKDLSRRSYRDRSYNNGVERAGLDADGLDDGAAAPLSTVVQ